MAYRIPHSPYGHGPPPGIPEPPHRYQDPRRIPSPSLHRVPRRALTCSDMTNVANAQLFRVRHRLKVQLCARRFGSQNLCLCTGVEVKIDRMLAVTRLGQQAANSRAPIAHRRALALMSCLPHAVLRVRRQSHREHLRRRVHHDQPRLRPFRACHRQTFPPVPLALVVWCAACFCIRAPRSRCTAQRTLHLHPQQPLRRGQCWTWT